MLIGFSTYVPNNFPWTRGGGGVSTQWGGGGGGQVLNKGEIEFLCSLVFMLEGWHMYQNT